MNHGRHLFLAEHVTASTIVPTVLPHRLREEIDARVLVDHLRGANDSCRADELAELHGLERVCSETKDVCVVVKVPRAGAEHRSHRVSNNVHYPSVIEVCRRLIVLRCVEKLDLLLVKAVRSLPHDRTLSGALKGFVCQALSALSLNARLAHVLDIANLPLRLAPIPP